MRMIYSAKIKRAIFFVALILFFTAISFAALGFAPINVADARDHSGNFVMAPVSNLTGNEYAGTSSLKLIYGSDVFYVPESYYVKLLDKPPLAQIYYKVEYLNMSDEFYLLVSTPDEKPISQNIEFEEDISPYPDIRLNLLEGTTAVMGGNEIDATYTVKLLGFGEDPTRLFVSATKDQRTVLGFVEKSHFQEFVLPYHPITQAQRDAILAKPEPNPGNGDIVSNTSKALRIILIIGITIPGVLIVFLLFKPSKDDRDKKVMRSKKRKRDDFDYDDPRRYRAYDRDDRRYDDRRYDDRREYDERDDYRRPYDDRRGADHRDDYYRDDRYRD